MLNNRAAVRPKRTPCRFEGFIGYQLTEDDRKEQRMRLYRRPGQAPLREKEGENKWQASARREMGPTCHLDIGYNGKINQPCNVAWQEKFFLFVSVGPMTLSL